MSAAPCVPKLLGADVELGNFVMGRSDRDQAARDAARLLLAEISAQAGMMLDLPASVPSGGDVQDWGRVFLPTNGGCAYIDLDHLELCIPEVLSAWDYVAAWHAMLHLTREAQSAVNERQPPDQRVHVLANNSDGRGNSYGGHLNVLMSRATWNNICDRKPHYLAYLAAFQASSLPITGQGKVGSENQAPEVEYQLSQRADFIETVTGTQTTFFRPLVNTRDEAHVGRSIARETDLARLHVIFFDTTLCHVATLLKVGTMQLVLAMMEAGAFDHMLALDDPLCAVRRWSHDPDLRARASLVAGGQVTAVELQRRFLDEAGRFVATGGADGIVRRAADILTLWDDTLTQLEQRDWSSLAGRLDWVLKRSLLERAMRARPGLRWDSPEIKHLDHLYGSLNPAEGLYWHFAGRGLVESVVSPGQIERLVNHPPANTRAWARAMVLRAAGTDVAAVNWDEVRVRDSGTDDADGTWRVELANPLAARRGAFSRAARAGGTRAALMKALGAIRESVPRHRRCPCGCGRLLLSPATTERTGGRDRPAAED